MMLRFFQAVVEIEVPTAPQKTRTNDERPAAAGMRSGGRPESNSTVSGTKNMAVGMPCKSVGRITVIWSTCRL